MKIRNVVSTSTHLCTGLAVNIIHTKGTTRFCVCHTGYNSILGFIKFLVVHNKLEFIFLKFATGHSSLFPIDDFRIPFSYIFRPGFS